MAEGAPDEADRQDAASPSDQKPAATSEDTGGPQVGDRSPEGLADGEDQHPEDLDAIPAPGQVQALAANYTSYRYTFNIGVAAGSILDSVITAAGQESDRQPPAGRVQAPGDDTAIIWQLDRAEVQRVREVYVSTSTDAAAAEVLRRHRVLVLQGRAHSGKATTAIRLLADLHDGDVRVVQPTATGRLSQLACSFTEPGGYLLDTLAPDQADELRLAVVARLAEQLRDPQHDGHLVITVDTLAPLAMADIARYVVSCPEEVPEPADVVWQHLAWEVGATDATAALERLERVEPAWWLQRLQRSAAPARMRDLAMSLATMARSGGSPETAKQQYQARTLAYVAEWFERHHATRERCFMLAVAVLNGTTYEEVDDAARTLEAKFAADPPDSFRPQWSYRSPARQRIRDASATLLPGRPSPEGSIQVVELDDPMLQPLTLAHIWHEHTDARGPLLQWLDELGRQPRFEIAGRAATAVGVLCASDLRYLHDRILHPWATDPGTTTPGGRREHTARTSAAVALVTAAREPKLVPPILDLLHNWATAPQRSGLPCTAATAYGLLDGALLKHALAGLRTLTEKQHPITMSFVVARSLENLWTAQDPRLVLGALRTWIITDPSSKLAAGARTVFKRLAYPRTPEAAPNGSTLPPLLRLAATQPDAAVSVARLWYTLLEQPDTEDIAQAALHDWLLRVDEGEWHPVALDRVLGLLLRSPRTRRRTRIALRRCAYDLELPTHAAMRYLWSSNPTLDTLREWIHIVVQWVRLSDATQG
jgi:hypothetical protein